MVIILCTRKKMPTKQKGGAGGYHGCRKGTSQKLQAAKQEEKDQQERIEKKAEAATYQALCPSERKALARMQMTRQEKKKQKETLLPETLLPEREQDRKKLARTQDLESKKESTRHSGKATSGRQRKR